MCDILACVFAPLLIMLVVIYILSNKRDYFEHQTFKITADGLIPVITDEDERTCPDNDQVYLPHYDACVRTCSSDREYDIYNDTCTCPSSTIQQSNGECKPKCNPSSDSFFPYMLSRNATNNTCINALERDDTCPPDTPFLIDDRCVSSHMIKKDEFSLDDFYYITIGEGSEEDCLNNPLCDALLDGGELVTFKPDRGRIMWKNALDSTASFKIRAK
jgi:hypothetical protein